MDDLIIVSLVAIGIYFMIKRGGCCGGRSGKRQNISSKKTSYCNKDHEIND